MNKITNGLSVLTFIVVAAAHAEDQGASKKGEKLAEMKAHALSMIDKRIVSLQEAKSCLSAAQSREDMKKCREERKSDLQEFKAERERFRSERKEKDS